MKFLIDRCAGRRLAQALAAQGHDVVEARSLGPDPGDRTAFLQDIAWQRHDITRSNDGTDVHRLTPTASGRTAS